MTMLPDSQDNATVYVVTVFDRSDGVYVFADCQDATDFRAAIGEQNASLSADTLIDHAMTRRLIDDEEGDDDDDGD